MSIGELSDEQARQLRSWRAAWLEIVASTAAADRPAAEAAIARIYKDHGAPRPVFVWVKSPAEGLFAIAALASWEGLLTVDRRLDAQAGKFLDPPWERGFKCDAVPDWLNRRLEAELGEPIRGAQGVDAMWAEIAEGGWRPAGKSAVRIARQIGLAEEEGSIQERALQAWKDVEDDIWQCRGSEIVDPWIQRFLWSRSRPEVEVAKCAFVRSLLSDRNPELDLPNVRPWEHAARACGMWWPLRGFCVASERPIAVHYDPAGQLHHRSRAALQFGDGFCLYAWHGTAVPKDWITAPEGIDPMTALRWHNVEQRRAVAEIVGWSRVLERLSVRVIDRSDDPTVGELIEALLPPAQEHIEGYDGELGRYYTKAEPVAARFLRVRCGTGRTFVLSVPREMRTAREANAWTYGMKPEEYDLEGRA